MSFGGGISGTISMVSWSYSVSSSLAIWPWASAMLDLIGLNSTALVVGESRYRPILPMVSCRGPSSDALTPLTISTSLEGVAKAWSFRGFLVLATLVAVTLVMNDSMGSTVNLVTPMMYDSQLVFNLFSSSFLLSSRILLTLGLALPSSWKTAFEDPSAKREDSPLRIRRMWSRM